MCVDEMERQRHLNNLSRHGTFEETKTKESEALQISTSKTVPGSNLKIEPQSHIKCTRLPRGRYPPLVHRLRHHSLRSCKLTSEPVPSKTSILPLFRSIKVTIPLHFRISDLQPTCPWRRDRVFPVERSGLAKVLGGTRALLLSRWPTFGLWPIIGRFGP